MPTKETHNSSSNLHFYHQCHPDKKILRIMFSKQRRLFSKNEIMIFFHLLYSISLYYVLCKCYIYKYFGDCCVIHHKLLAGIAVPLSDVLASVKGCIFDTKSIVAPWFEVGKSPFSKLIISSH